MPVAPGFVPSAMAQDAPRAWMETASAQPVPAGETIVLIAEQDSELSLSLAEALAGQLAGLGYSVGDEGSFLLRFSTTQLDGGNDGNQTLTLSGGGGSDGDSNITAQVQVPLGGADIGPTQAGRQTLNLTLYDHGGALYWRGVAEAPLDGRTRADTAAMLGEILLARINRNLDRQPLP